jgi:cytochrome b
MIFKDGFGFPKNDTTHMQWVYRLYKVMYTIFTIMAISGLILAFYTSLGIDKEIAHQIKEMHETLAWSVVAFVVLHLGGVIAAEQKNQKGIVSQMISG